MKIESARIDLSSTHLSLERHTVRERLQFQTGNGPDPAGPSVRLSSAGREKAAGAAAVEEGDASTMVDPMLAVLKAMLFRLFGIEAEVFDARELASPQESAAPVGQPGANGARAPGFAVEYEFHEERVEVEVTRFAASGEVRTADGRTLRFDLSLQMSRSFSERTDLSIRIGDAPRKKDPLVINFEGPAATLSDRSFRIDLDGDGTVDEARFAGAGSGFLVFDRNANGRIDRADELFGPRTGDGFGELATLDADHNGWIDEGDAAFARLQVWTKDEQGRDVLRSLADAKVGAIGLSHLATPFEIREGTGATLGSVRSSGVYLAEDGRVGSVQQIDLAV